MPDSPNDVVVIGCVGIDTNVYSNDQDIDFNIEGYYTENIDYISHPGAFASRGYTRLGRRAAFLGHVGNDFCGRYIQEEFRRDGIDTRALFIDPAGTNRSVNFMLRDGQRRNFYDGKGHMNLHLDLATCRAVMRGARLAHFNIPNWARELLPVAREMGVVIACDIQDIKDPEDAYRQDFIEQADVLFFSATKCSDPASFMRQCIARKPGQIVISGMGSMGCMMGTSKGIVRYTAVELDLPVIDSNGAGDSLAVGFLNSHFFEGYSLEDSILRGQIAARYACTQKASSSTLISLEQLEREYAFLKGELVPAVPSRSTI